MSLIAKCNQILHQRCQVTVNKRDHDRSAPRSRPMVMGYFWDVNMILTPIINHSQNLVITGHLCMPVCVHPPCQRNPRNQPPKQEGAWQEEKNPPIILDILLKIGLRSFSAIRSSFLILSGLIARSRCIILRLCYTPFLSVSMQALNNSEHLLGNKL